ncbi:hypothetical protein IAD21_03380 [Abditibacteriota bacterium]|nr:hypothetical protein IAD21_03380 [Abditibacteriota bacterium]
MTSSQRVYLPNLCCSSNELRLGRDSASVIILSLQRICPFASDQVGLYSHLNRPAL